MAMQWTIDQTVDLHKGVRTPQVWPEALMLCGDDRAHVWRVRVLDGGAPATLTGSVTGYFVRADGVTVSVTGALTGNVASVVLKSGCYAADGDMAAVMRLASEGTVLARRASKRCAPCRPRAKRRSTAKAAAAATTEERTNRPTP